MFQRLRSKLTYANVVSTLCLFLVLGGGAAFAANQLAKNSVGTKQPKKNAVTGEKVKDASLTGADIKVSTLGTVPNADNASKASNTDKLGGADANAFVKGADPVGGSEIGGTYAAPTLRPSEPWRFVGTPGNPEFETCGTPYKWQPTETGTANPAFYRDRLGIVHLQGSVKCTGVPTTNAGVFELPPGYRTAQGSGILNFTSYWQGAAKAPAFVAIDSTQHKVYISAPSPLTSGGQIAFDGVSFRCAPSGVAGCP